ncbi:HSP20-like chaperone [Aspergillus karnatakaensis]|uniref:HSP20-like chaperone n=1 Tax=Aspergillus karnatakaensis TaxID=1810916 RepID=UPI003CCCABC7
MSTHPEVLWAQRSSATDEARNVVFLTVNLPNTNPNSLVFNLEAKRLTFSATAGEEKKEYTFTLNLYAEIDPDHSLRKFTDRSLFAVPQEREEGRWIDEDEQNDKANDDFDDDFGDFGDNTLGGQGGMDFDKMMADIKGDKNEDD